MVIISDTSIREWLRSIYEGGTEDVIALVSRLQAQALSLTERALQVQARVGFDNFLHYLVPRH